MDETVVIDERLLIVLHDGGVRLSESSSRLVAHWGRHLLEDWRSLELLAQRQERPPETLGSELN